MRLKTYKNTYEIVIFLQIMWFYIIASNNFLLFRYI